MPLDGHYPILLNWASEILTGFGAAGNKFALIMNKIQFTKISDVDEQGMLYYDCDFNVNYDSTTEFSLTLT